MIWYFAYGSNLKMSRMRKRGVTISDYRTGYINNYSFSYSKVGTDDTGKGNILPEKLSKVWGAFYLISFSDYVHLHKTYEVGYRRIEFTGESKGSKIQAKSFQALEKNKDENMIPSNSYYYTVIQGAQEHNLPKRYIQILRRAAE